VVDDRTVGPLVLGGSVLLHQASVASAVEAAFRGRVGSGEVVRVADGVVGAAVLGLRASGVVVDSSVFDRLRGSLADLRRG
jgi:glucosamine kinase